MSDGAGKRKNPEQIEEELEEVEKKLNDLLGADNREKEESDTPS